MPLLGLRPGLTGMTENPFLAYRFAAFSLDVLFMIPPRTSGSPSPRSRRRVIGLSKWYGDCASTCKRTPSLYLADAAWAERSKHSPAVRFTQGGDGDDVCASGGEQPISPHSAHCCIVGAIKHPYNGEPIGHRAVPVGKRIIGAVRGRL